MATANTKERHCLRCGRGDNKVDFRTPLAMKCVECDEVTDEERRKYHQRYHKARTIAVKKLIDKHPDEYDRLLTNARRQIASQDGRRKSVA